MAKRALIYQIYPASFGNLNFITSKIPSIAKNIQPDYIWLSPFFKSPWQEGGYDVADYKEVDQRFGDLTDLKKLVFVAEQHGIKILLDLVLNHTSVEHEWFQKSRCRDPWYADYYIWLDKPLNWQSFFGGPAYEYDCIRGQYYLHLFDKSQPDLNFENPRVTQEFQKIIKFWTDLGIAGFRVDSANVLSENKLRRGYLPRIPGFFNYFQTKRTVQVLDRLLGGNKLFAIAEPVGGVFLSFTKFRELTRHIFDAAFNVGTLDIADTVLSDKASSVPVRYKKWFRKLARWSVEPSFSLAIESHDAPRAPSRFDTDPKILAMLQFLLPANYPCVYQGQEIGTKNPELGDNIHNYPGVLSHAIYQQLLRSGKSKKDAMKIVKKVSRDNARQPLDWSAFASQAKQPDSVLNFYRKLTALWRTDPVLTCGNLKVKKTTKSGVFDFERRYHSQIYQVHLDFSGKTTSTLAGPHGIILSSKPDQIIPRK